MKSDSHYNMDKPWKHAEWKKSITEDHIFILFSLYNMSRIGKSIGTESRLVVAVW